MTHNEVAAKLQHFNEWRRGHHDEQPDPREIGEAIDAAVEMIDRLEAAESECLEEARLNGIGSEREAALMAKLEAAEKNNSAWLYANAPGGWIDNLRIENEALRAKIAEMERQEHVGEIVAFGESLHEVSWNRGKLPPLGAKLYALPGAKGEEK